MVTEDIADEIINDLASGLIDKSNDEIIAALSKYDLEPEEVTEILDAVDAARDAISDEATDAGAGAETAENMANEDNTEVSVTEEDKDNDGDADTVTVEKENPENDSNSNSEESDKPHDEDLADTDMSPTEYSKTTAEKRGAKKNEPAPDMFKFSPEVIGALTSHRY